MSVLETILPMQRSHDTLALDISAKQNIISTTGYNSFGIKQSDIFLLCLKISTWKCSIQKRSKMCDSCKFVEFKVKSQINQQVSHFV